MNKYRYEIEIDENELYLIDCYNQNGDMLTFPERYSQFCRALAAKELFTSLAYDSKVLQENKNILREFINQIKREK
jgi:hypothetical protein